MRYIKHLSLTSAILYTTLGCYDFSEFDCFQSVNGCVEDASLMTYTSRGPEHSESVQPPRSHSDMYSVRDSPTGGADIISNQEIEMHTAGVQRDNGASVDDPGGFDTLGECDPEQLQICEECDPNRDRVVAYSDERCDVFDCGTLRHFELSRPSLTTTICEQVFYRASSSNCVAINQCATIDEYCVENRREPIVSSDELPLCEVLEGCVGETAPVRAPRASGDFCSGGIGICTESNECTHLNCAIADVPNGELCFDQRLSHGRCSFVVTFEERFGSFIPNHCAAACQESGGECVGSYVETNLCGQSTTHINDMNCFTRLAQSQVCVCEYLL